MDAVKPLAIDLFCGLGGTPKPVFLAYVVTCKVTGRQYVGITGRTLQQRWKEHVSDAKTRTRRSILGTAIRKYGSDQFSIEPIFCALSWADLCVAERVLIAQHGTLKPGGYNLSPGGEGCLGLKRSLETRALMRDRRLGKRHTAETKTRLAHAKTGISQNVGASNGGAKLSEDQAREAKRLLKAGAKQRTVARQFGISYTAAWKIANDLKWTHL